jgi:hypothetical protein
VRDAAKWLDSRKSEQPKEVSPNGTLEPLPYIEHERPAVEALGFSPDDGKALGVGYSPKCIMKGLVVIPIRLEDGTLAGYVGVTEIERLPPNWHGLPTNVTRFPKKTA